MTEQTNQSNQSFPIQMESESPLYVPPIWNNQQELEFQRLQAKRTAWMTKMEAYQECLTRWVTFDNQTIDIHSAIANADKIIRMLKPFSRLDGVHDSSCSMDTTMGTSALGR